MTTYDELVDNLHKIERVAEPMKSSPYSLIAFWWDGNEHVFDVGELTREFWIREFKSKGWNSTYKYEYEQIVNRETVRPLRIYLIQDGLIMMAEKHTTKNIDGDRYIRVVATGKNQLLCKLELDETGEWASLVITLG